MSEEAEREQARRVEHYDGCHFRDWEVCTCGLLHMLSRCREPAKYFPMFREEVSRQDAVFQRGRDRQKENPRVAYAEMLRRNFEQ